MSEWRTMDSDLLLSSKISMLSFNPFPSVFLQTASCTQKLNRSVTLAPE
jgi:hypothetical protein